MSTTTTNLGLTKPATGDLNWGATLNADLDLIDSLVAAPWLLVTLQETPSTTLHVVVAPGKVRNAAGTVYSYAGANVAVTSGATNYLYLNASGTLVQNTTGWTAGVEMVRVAVVVAGATTITSVTDARVPFVTVGSNPATLYLPLAGGTLADPADLALGTTTGTKLGTAAAQKLGFWGKTPIIQPASANQAALGTLTAVTLTDNSGGTPSTTLAAGITDAVAKNAVASLAAQINHAVADLAAVKTLLNQLQSDLVAAGLIKGSA